MSIRRPHEHRTVMIVLTVTPIDRLHKSDGPNGVKGGQLKRIKYEIRLGEPNRSMSMGPKEGRAHSLC